MVRGVINGGTTNFLFVSVPRAKTIGFSKHFSTKLFRPSFIHVKRKSPSDHMRQFRAFKCFALNKYVSPLESEDIAKRWTTVSMQEGGHVMKFKITDFKILDRVISGLVGKSGITCLPGGALAIEQTIWLCNAPYADRLLYPSHRVSMAQDVGYGRGKGAKSIHNPTDRELDSIVFDEENSESEPSEISLCLVGTLWTERPFNAQAFMRTMKQERVREQEPWNFDIQIVLLSEIQGHEQPSDVQIYRAPLWVRAYDIPLAFRKQRCIEVLGNKAPLLRGTQIRTKEGKDVWIYFKYERLPWFCYHCGRMGHVAKDCSYVDDDDLLNPALYQYSEELRASPLRRMGMQQPARPVSDLVRRKLVFKPNESRRASPRTSEQGGEKSGEVGEHSLGSSNIKGRVDNQIEVESISSGSYPIKAILKDPLVSPMSKIVYLVQSFGLADSREDIGGEQSAVDNSQPAVILPTQTLQSTDPRLTTRGQPPKAQVTSAPSITLAPHEIPVTFDVSLDGTTAAASKQRTKKGRKVGTSSRFKPQEHSQVSASSSQPKSQSLAPAMSDAPNLSKTITWKRRGREKARE
ncbi:hypothetical protein Tsubulata_008117 [Turnera subulata]|uniref:CCHC-type domain-containing protein n=1 Tax=Turnera subulata TaxID=218843 RepID=A0A9Q0JJC0_9ROSI|nr:hypothetical protein Tsubulata_008117 [Turnera subulata]